MIFKNKILLGLSLLIATTGHGAWFDTICQKLNNDSRAFAACAVVLATVALYARASKTNLPDKLQENQPDFYIFFDLGDVLLATDKFKVFCGEPSLFIRHICSHGLPQEDRLFAMMDQATGLFRGLATTNGKQLPGIMCNWLQGATSSDELVETITSLPQEDRFFKSSLEQQMLCKMAQLMLPANLIASRKLTSTMQLFAECCQKYPGQVGILSNWDADSVELLKQKFPEIFSKIDQKMVFFSSECSHYKPNEAIYKHVEKKLDNSRARFILIDDQKVNVDAAINCGWSAVWHLNDMQTAKGLDKVLRSLSCLP